MTIVANPTLNDLWVTCSNRDLDQVKEILDSIDRPPTEEFQPNSKPRYIQVKNQNAEDIATKIRALYASRLDGGSGQNRGPQQPNPADFINALRGRGGNQRRPCHVVVGARTVRVTDHRDAQRSVSRDGQRLSTPVRENHRHAGRRTR